MRRLLSPIAVVLAASACLFAGADSSLADQASPTLYIDYALNCTFTIVDDSGKGVTTLAPGTYALQFNEPDFGGYPVGPDTGVTACRGVALFQLTGPNVSLKTSGDDGTGVNVFYVTLLPSSTYVAVDNNQPAVARLTFTTLASGAPTTTTIAGAQNPTQSAPTSSSSVVGSKAGASGSKALIGTLDAVVNSTGLPSLTFKGKAVTSLKAGRYTVSVLDKSTKGGFIVQQSTKNATTVSGVPFVGRRSATITLAVGQWLFYPTVVGKKSYFVVTSK